MSTPTKDIRRLQSLSANWQNRSHSSLGSASDAATFHSAHAITSSQMELHPLRQLTSNSQHQSPQPKVLSSPILQSIEMTRKDSGYSDTPRSPISSRRTSVSSTPRNQSPSKTKRRTHTSNSSASRPSTKRAARSTPSTTPLRLSSSGGRPSLQARHTTPYAHTQPYQFFQFPSLADSHIDPNQEPTSSSPPPTTVQYWTSDNTRRLEYAAIDAASRGVRGFFIKLVPDCILPASSRRTRFCEGDGDSDAGSVRRYRLALPEEKKCVNASQQECRRRAGLLRRWTSLRKGGST